MDEWPLNSPDQTSIHTQGPRRIWSKRRTSAGLEWFAADYDQQSFSRR